MSSETGKFIGFLAMALGMFVALLDIQIVAGSLKDIQGGLSASRDEMTWVQTSYLIAEIVMIPLSGWLAKVLSTRWLFTASAVTFTIASLCCGLAWNIESMIAFRIVQGFVGGAMIPLAFSAGFAMFKGPKAAMIPAVLGVMGTLAPTLGPTLGGWITETFSWRYLFYVNLAPGLLIAVAVPLLVRVDEPDFSLMKGFDAFSIPFIAIALGCLGYVLEEGVRKDWFDDPLVAACAAASAAAWCVVIWRGLTHPRPVLDFGAFRIRNFALGCALSFVVGVGNYGAIFVLPVFLGEVRDYNSLDIGEAVFVTGVAQVVATMLIAATANRLDQRLLLGCGLVAYGVSLVMMTPLTNQWGGAELFWALVLRGAASMAVVVPITSFALGGLPSGRLPMASGLYNLMRNLGGAASIAGIGIMLQERQSLHYSRLAERVTPFQSDVAQAQAAFAARFGDLFTDQLRGDRAAVLELTEMAKREALVLTVSDVLWVMALIFFVALALVPLLRWPKQT
ncbi:DHA2 family efflux MFS transporter permease subunit [Hansschlegelia sp. KR7-227]|uniref:DHA2 family efflux MFS transporter permease subunit n=1 Tax=Hansschlegelia sp. KR7-227 TaxID=3400914 RepID=UPI003C013D08